MKKWRKGYPSAGRLVKIEFRNFSFQSMEVADQQKREEMAKKLSHRW